MNSYMEGRQYIFGLQLNGTYKVNDALSAALGLRVNIVNSGYMGHLANIRINPVHPSLNPSGDMMSASTFFTNAAGASQAAFNSLTPLMTNYSNVTMSNLVAAGALTPAQVSQLSAGLGADVSSLTVAQVQGGFGSAVTKYSASANSTLDKHLDCEQSGWGLSPIVSLNYHLNGLNLAAKYEFKSSIQVKNKTSIDETGLYPDGAKVANDIPAYLTLGAEYDLCKKWKVSGGYHHFFDSDAGMANGKQQYINGGLNEYLLGSEYSINDMFVVSAGGQITDTQVTDDYQSDMSYSLDSYTIGFGGAVKLSDRLKINVGYFFTNYAAWTKKSTNYNKTTLPGTDVYDRTNNVFGIGLDYNF